MITNGFHSRQDPVLDTRLRNQDEVVFRTSIHGRFQYNCCPTLTDYARYIMSSDEGAKYCNELLYGHTHAGWFDIDSPHTLHQLGHTTQDEFIRVAGDFIIREYREHLGVTVQPKHMRWMCSSRPGKTSFHVIVQHPDYFWHVDDRSKGFRAFLQQVGSDSLEVPGLHFLEHNSVNNTYEQKSVFDTKLATKNRQFRSVFCSKPDTDVPFQPCKPVTRIGDMLRYFVTVPESDTEERGRLKFAAKSTPRSTPVSGKFLAELAMSCGCVVHEVCGSLVKLKNLDTPRRCVLTDAFHDTNKGYLVIQNDGREILFGCHGCPDAPRKLLHKSEEDVGEYRYYRDHHKLAANFAAAESAEAEIRKYLRSTVRLIDDPDKPYFVTCVEASVSGFNGKLFGKHYKRCGSMFKGFNDVVFPDCEDSLGQILNRMAQRRALRTYSQARWIPYAKNSGHRPQIADSVFNLFGGFALEKVVPKRKIDFKSTHIWQLITRNLTNREEECTNYLLSTLAHKLQRPAVKMSICNIFADAAQGVGKSSFTEFLTRLFSVNDRSTVAVYNTPESYLSNFNALDEYALFSVLEEVKGTRLKTFDNILKDKISCLSQRVEKKGVDAEMVPSYAQVFVYSNEFCPLRVARDDRRMMFYNCNAEVANQKAFFDKLYAEFDDLDVMKSAFDFFMNYDVEHWDYRKFPSTELREKVIQCSSDSNHWWLRELFFSGEYAMTDTNEFEFSSSDLWHYYKRYVDENGIKCQKQRSVLIAQFEVRLQPQKRNGVYVIPVEHASKVCGK